MGKCCEIQSKSKFKPMFSLKAGILMENCEKKT